MNWVEFLDDNHVPFVTRGPNTKRGELSIKCPFCGDLDPSEHLGINPENGNWGCLRDQNHRGKRPYRLVQAILGCTHAVAGLTVRQYDTSDPDRFDHDAAFQELAETAPEVVEAPPDFRAIKPVGSTAKFWRYLEQRGFDEPAAVIENYSLSCCLTGRWKDRLYFRFYQDGQLIAWQGRALVKTVSAPRYLSSKTLKHTVFNEDELMKGGDLLFVVEGPFDAMKLDYYGRAFARATCTFGVTPAIEQITILNILRKRFGKVVVLFDQDATGQAFAMSDWLQYANVKVGELPEGIKDPGELSPRAIDRLIRSQ